MGSVVEMPLNVVATEGVSQDDLALINRFTLRELTADDVFVYEAIVSSDATDSYYTRMDPQTTLRNYAKDLENGVPMMNFHETAANPLGQSFKSRIEEKDGSTVVRAWFYIPRDVSINGTSTNDLIRQIETGTTRQMSVGFGGSRLWYRCDKDGRSLQETSYFPGDRDENNEPVTFWIMDANLREVSLVYKASCPDAYIQKARSDISSNKLDATKLLALEERFHTRFDRSEESFSFSKKRNEGEHSMKIADIKKAIEDGDITLSALKKLISDLDENSAENKENEDTGRMVRAMFGDDASKDMLKTMKAEAATGRKYKEDLIEDAVKARASIQGDDFNADSYKSMLDRADLDFIKEEKASYEKMKQTKFTSGRQFKNESGDEDVVTIR